MRVTLLKPIGYCRGVVEAISATYAVKKENPDSDIYVFGHLVHNDSVIEELKKSGIHSVDTEKKNPFSVLAQFKRGDVVIFSAHGHSEKYEDYLRERGIKYYDTTCRIVRDNLSRIKANLDRGVIYIGKKGHPETEAALSVSEQIVLYDIKEGIDYASVKKKSPLIVNQTTLSVVELSRIYEDIKRNVPEAELSDEICNATRIRQETLRDFKDEFDLILIVGSERSSNTDKLFQIAKTSHPSIPCYKVNGKEDLIGISLKNRHHAVIAGGTSTPFRKIEEIKEYLEDNA